MKNTNIFKIFMGALLLSLTINLQAEGNNPAGPAVQTRSLKVAPYMMAPVSSWTPNVVSSLPAVRVEAQGDEKLGFRVIHIAPNKKATKAAAVDLATSGVIQTGDILLSFRPEWNGTLAYAHMQLGISHAALAFVMTEGNTKFVHSLETPLNYSSPLNSSHHYGDLNAIHIIRPSYNPGEKDNLAKWAKKIFANSGKFGFFSDYGKPYYKRGFPNVSTPLEQIKQLRRVVRGEAGAPAKFDSYCSEFVWTLLGLRGCNPDAPAEGCEKPIFDNTSPVRPAINGGLTGLIANLGAPAQGGEARDAGLVQGPEAALVTAKVDYATRKSLLTESAFVDILRSPDQLAGRMSSGHRAVAEANSALMNKINTAYYGGGTEGAGENPAVAAAINQQVVENFSPTSFMIRSNARLDGLSYVGTVVFE